MQAELQVKTGPAGLDSSHLSSYVPPQPVSQPALQRTTVNRQHARRSFQGLNQRPTTGTMHAQRDSSFALHSPQGQPTPSSHASSPTAMSAKSFGSVQHNDMTPPASTLIGQPQPQQQFRAPQQHVRQQYMMQHPNRRQGSGSSFSRMSNTPVDQPQQAGNFGGPGAAAYPSPYQSRSDQLGKFPPIMSQ